MLNNRGPSTDPCGTPDNNSDQELKASRPSAEHLKSSAARLVFVQIKDRMSKSATTVALCTIRRP